MKKLISRGKSKIGFMLIEVLIALALFGLSAVFLVDGAFVAARTIRVMKDTGNGTGSSLGSWRNI